MQTTRIASRIASLAFLCASAFAQQVDVGVVQHEWVLDDHTIPYSRAGSLEFDFSTNHTQLLAANGGGYLNVWLQNNRTGGIRWVVRNYYYSFPDMRRLEGSQITTLFGIGTANGLPWGPTAVSAKVTAQAQGMSGMHTFRMVQPRHEGYHMGGGWHGPQTTTAPPGGGGGESGFEGMLDLIPEVIGGLLGVPPVMAGGISAPVCDLPEITSSPTECVPTAVAMSITYLCEQNGTPCEEAQDMKDNLSTYMSAWEDGADLKGLRDGKLLYVDEHDLPISTTWIPGSQAALIPYYLNEGCDVEIGFMVIHPQTGEVTSHMGMLTSMELTPDGGARARFVHDPNERDDQPGKKEESVDINPDGTFYAGTLDGFVVECWN